MSSESKPFLTHYSSTPSFTSSTTSLSLPHKKLTTTQTLLHNLRLNLLPYTLIFIFTSSLWLTLVYIFIPDISTTYNYRTSHPDARRHNITSGMKLLTCGDSKTIKEAKQRGCKYDVLLNGWVPEPCYDEEFIQEYLDDSTSTAYRYPNLTSPLLTIDEITAAGTYYTSTADHVNHCATMWKKQFWVLFEGRGTVDSFVASPGHMDHCASFLAEVGVAREDVRKGSTEVVVGWAGCWVRE